MAPAPMNGEPIHAFVRGLADGSLPEVCFRHCPGRGYLFLIHFARTSTLAAYKADNLGDIGQAAVGLSAFIANEPARGIRFRLGIDKAVMAALPEAEETMALPDTFWRKGCKAIFSTSTSHSRPSGGTDA